MPSSKEFQADDLHLSAYLVAIGIPLIRVEKSGRFGVFFFPEKKAKEEAIKFTSGNALVEPRSLFSAIRELKRITDETPAGTNRSGVFARGRECRNHYIRNRKDLQR